MLDPLLRRFVETEDEDAAERELDAIVEHHALPLARAIVARKLRSYASGGPPNPEAQERDDVVADAMVTLVERLYDARAAADRTPIENFANYTAAVVHSACAHHVRRRFPERVRLKNRLRYALSIDPRLAMWDSDAGAACGLAEWRGRPPHPAATAAVRRAGEPLQVRWGDLHPRDLADALARLLTAAAAPVDYDEFVGLVADAARLVEPRDTHDLATVASREPSADVVLDRRAALTQVWEEVGKLPVRQRAALLLNLRDSSGAGMLWLLPVAGIATVRQIAGVLEMHDVELARLWGEIPLSDAAIGQRLGCTRQQVINLRVAARKRLTNRLVGAGRQAPGRAGRRGNLQPVSASLKGSM